MSDEWGPLHFHITAPTNEPNLAMKFSDWVNTANASDTIPVAGNMRISSLQADNSDATIPITAANTYTSPLHITGDLDPSTPGDQVQVKVEVAIPASTANGSYATTYGVQSSP